MDKSLDGIKVIFLDLDGTIYLGGELIEGALDFLERCELNAVTRGKLVSIIYLRG